MDNEIKQTVDEPRVEFKMISDRSVYNIVNEDINKTLVEISGYDLQINFNMEYLNSIEDVEAAVTGLGNLFRDIIMEKLLEHKKQNE
ncbi:MAG: hypothetical protein J6S14_16200 [Clostridia bacterium]|nr:hypothetical protein [Clostridia bacterium]MBR4405181.1 hypothetical protein [Bacteroidaceae bacterium]